MLVVPGARYVEKHYILFRCLLYTCAQQLQPQSPPITPNPLLIPSFSGQNYDTSFFFLSNHWYPHYHYPCTSTWRDFCDYKSTINAYPSFHMYHIQGWTKKRRKKNQIFFQTYLPASGITIPSYGNITWNTHLFPAAKLRCQEEIINPYANQQEPRKFNSPTISYNTVVIKQSLR